MFAVLFYSLHLNSAAACKMNLCEEAEERYDVAGEDKEGMQEPQKFASPALPNTGAHALHCHAHSVLPCS